MKRVEVFTWYCPWNFDKVVIYSNGSVTVTDMSTGEERYYSFKDANEASSEMGRMYY